MLLSFDCFLTKPKFIEKTKIIMKKLLLVVTFAVAGISGSVSANDNLSSDSVKENLAPSGKRCFIKVYDSQGHYVGLVEVKCPDVIVIED